MAGLIGGLGGSGATPGGAAGGELGGTYPSPTVDPGSDETAIHDDTAGEIAALTEKIAPVAADLIIIEDSAAGNTKKKVQLGNTPGGSAGSGHWAIVTMSAPQAGLDESGPDLVAGFDTIYDGSSGHGITVLAGVISLPANTSGMRWELSAGLWGTMTVTGTTQWHWTENPESGTPTAAGLPGDQTDPTNATRFLSGGEAGSAMHWIAGPETVGVIITSVTGAGTVTISNDYSKIRIREVKA